MSNEGYKPYMISSGQTGACGHCGKLPLYDDDKDRSHEVYDGCIGKLDGNIMNACCGHGDINCAYIQYWGGAVIRGADAALEQERLVKLRNK